jgi:hypothetical protein
MKTLVYVHKCRQSFHLEDRLAAVQRKQEEDARKREITARVAEEVRIEEARRLVQAHGDGRWSGGARDKPGAGELMLASLRSLAR